MGLFSNMNIMNKHKKIERFMFMFFSILIPLVLMSFVSVYNKFGVDSNTLSSRAIYTTEGIFSRTNEVGKVVGVYTNEEKTRGMVLIKFDSGVNISSSASDYKVFTTASNLKQGKENLSSKPEGFIYVFGTSGYIGLYFVNNSGFESQIFKSTIRMEKEFKTVDENSIKGKELSGESYAKYDQADFYYNLGASQATKLKTLENANFSVQDFYVEALGTKVNNDKVAQINERLNRMSKLMLQIREMKSRLETISVDNTKLVVPDLPNDIKSDNFSGSGENILYSTDYVYPGGLNYNIKDVDLKLGYFKTINNSTINPENLSLSRFLVKLKNDQANSDIVGKFEPKWTMSDGSKLDDFVKNIGVDNAAVSSMNDNIQTYVTLINDYLTDKIAYQTGDLRDLLSLDIVLENATTNVDSASNDRFLFY